MGPALEAASPEPAENPSLRGLTLPYAAVVATDDAPDRALVPSRQTVRPVRCPKMRVFGLLPTGAVQASSMVMRRLLRNGSSFALVGAHEGGQGLIPRSQRIAGTVPASPPRSRAVWAGRQPLQPPLRRPGASACHGGRSAFGSDGTVKLQAQLPHHCRPQGFPRPPCPSPRNRTRGGGRRHRASDTPRQRER